MLFAAVCIDKPQSLDIRKANRPAHLEFLKSLGDRVRIGGAVLGPDQETPIGSMLIFEGESEAEIRALLAKDPYALAGLFERVDLMAWRQAVGQPLA